MLDKLLAHFASVCIHRLQSRSLHSHVLRHLLNRVVDNISLNVDQHADLSAAMNIGGHKTIILCHLLKSADVHVLADNGNLGRQSLLNGHGRILSPCLTHKRVDIYRGRHQCLCGHICRIGLELLVLCHKVGLRVNFNYNRLLGVVCESRNHDALRRNTACLLCCACKSFLSQKLNRFIHIAVSSRKSLLAVHHAGTGHLSQLFYHCCCYCHDYFLRSYNGLSTNIRNASTRYPQIEALPELTSLQYLLPLQFPHRHQLLHPVLLQSLRLPSLTRLASRL